MNRFRKILAAVAYVAIPGATVLAATGVGTVGAGALAGVGLLAGGILHFMDSPRTPEDARVLIEQARDTAKAVKALRKGQSGS